jgi:hypothetical protein
VRSALPALFAGHPKPRDRGSPWRATYAKGAEPLVRSDSRMVQRALRDVPRVKVVWDLRLEGAAEADARRLKP